MTRELGWYVDAASVRTPAFDPGALEARSGPEPEESLGVVRGFVVDPESRQLTSVVIETTGWIAASAHLVPPAHTRVDAEQKVLWVDASRNALGRFPVFDASAYARCADEEIAAVTARIVDTYADDPGVDLDRPPAAGAPAEPRDAS